MKRINECMSVQATFSILEMFSSYAKNASREEDDTWPMRSIIRFSSSKRDSFVVFRHSCRSFIYCRMREIFIDIILSRMGVSSASSISQSLQ